MGRYRAVKILAVVLFTCLFSASLSEAAGLRSQIIGKWVEAGGTEKIEFLNDGTVIVVERGTSAVGDYRFIDNSRLRIDLKGLYGSMVVEVSKNAKTGELFLKEPNGKVKIYVIEAESARRLAVARKAAANENLRILVSTGGKTGYVDRTGKYIYIVSPQFSPFVYNEGLVAVLENATGKFGVLDESGKLIIIPQFDNWLVFTEGLAAARDAGVKKTGFIDKTGKYVINPQFDAAGVFSEGVASVKLNGKMGFIRKGGEYIVTPQFDNVLAFTEGYAAVNYGGKWGFIDKKGNDVISPQFDDAAFFNEGLAAVMLEGKWGFIDKSGDFVINPQFNLKKYLSEKCFSEGLALVTVDPDSRPLRKYGFIDKKGRYVINQLFGDAKPFSEGFAAAKEERDGKWGYIDRSGKFVIKQQFDAAYDFKEGLASVKLGTKWGLIDKTGKYVINPQYDTVGVVTGKLRSGNLIALDRKIVGE